MSNSGSLPGKAGGLPRLIRDDLEGIGMRIGANDLFIAAIAKSYDLILVTHNTDEFLRVTGLQVEDWYHEIK